MKEHLAVERLKEIKHNTRDPNPWMALYLDSSVPFHPKAKANFLIDVSSRSRQFMMPLVRPFCRLMICLIKIIKTLSRMLSNPPGCCIIQSIGGCVGSFRLMQTT